MGRPTPGKRIAFSRYALARLAQRGLSRAEVEAVVKNPLACEQSALDPTGFVLTRTVGGRRIAVVVAPQGARWVVVTAWEAD